MLRKNLLNRKCISSKTVKEESSTAGYLSAEHEYTTSFGLRCILALEWGERHSGLPVGGARVRHLFWPALHPRA